MQLNIYQQQSDLSILIVIVGKFFLDTCIFKVRCKIKCIYLCCHCNHKGDIATVKHEGECLCAWESIFVWRKRHMDRAFNLCQSAGRGPHPPPCKRHQFPAWTVSVDLGPRGWVPGRILLFSSSNAELASEPQVNLVLGDERVFSGAGIWLYPLVKR